MNEFKELNKWRDNPSSQIESYSMLSRCQSFSTWFPESVQFQLKSVILYILTNWSESLYKETKDPQQPTQYWKRTVRGPTFPDFSASCKATVIKAAGGWERKWTDRSTEQNKELRNRPTHIQSTVLWPRSKSNAMGQKQSFQETALKPDRHM